MLIIYLSSSLVSNILNTKLDPILLLVRSPLCALAYCLHITASALAYCLHIPVGSAWGYVILNKRNIYIYIASRHPLEGVLDISSVLIHIIIINEKGSNYHFLCVHSVYLFIYV
jgi:hypothetical protein